MFSFLKEKLTIIGDGTFVCSIPKCFITETEENGTLLVYNPKNDDIIYRISFISFEPKDKNEKKAGEKHVQEDINSKNLKQKKIGQYNVAITSENQIENDSYMIKYWKFGLDNNIFILSLTFPNSKINNLKKYNAQIENIIKSIHINEHSDKLIVDGTEINYKKRLGNQNQKPQLRDLTQEEINIINTNIDLGNKIVNSSSVEKSVTNELRILDIVFKNWLNGNSIFSEDEIASGLGILFGEIARKELSMEWQMITDEYGTDYCLVHRKTNIMIFPISTVYKRIDSKEYDFFWDIYQIVKNQIEEINT
ncbi:MAG: DUF3806 domain-containing protein [Treponema sp.]|nr:DUF3806 domain-containing protein [Treponema sp.]